MLIRRPALWPWAAIPILLTVFMLAGALWGVYWYSAEVLAVMLPRPMGDGALAPLARIIWRLIAILFGFVSFIVLFVTLEVLGTAIAGPFHDRLSMLVESELRGSAPEPSDWSVVWDSISHSFLALGLYLLVMVPLFVINIIPMLGEILYLFLGTIATSLVLARQMFDYPLSRHRVSFRGKLEFIRDNAAASLGLGLATAVLLAVPVVNLLSLAIAVMGGTILFCSVWPHHSEQPSDGSGG